MDYLVKIWYFFKYFFKKMNKIYYFFWISNFVIYSWNLLARNKNIREPQLGNMSITSEMMTTSSIAVYLAGKFMVLIPEAIKMRVFWKKWKNVIVTWVMNSIEMKMIMLITLVNLTWTRRKIQLLSNLAHGNQEQRFTKPD